MVTIIDPPSGWMYGFPKVLDRSIPFREFLEKSGYPAIDFELAERHSRYWEEDINAKSGPTSGSK